MFGLELIAKLFKILRSGGSPEQISGGFILGMILGLTPLWNLHNLIVFFLLVIINVNLGAAIFAFLIFSTIAFLLDPLFHSFGYYILTGIPGLHDFWVTMFNTPILGISNFNNTVVIGSFIVSIILLLPVYFSMKQFVILYREKLETRIQKLKFVRVIKASRLYSFYEKIKNLGG